MFLALIVGVAALAVNRFLSNAHSASIQANLPVLSVANDIDRATQTIAERSRDLVQLDTLVDLERNESDLQDALGIVQSRLADLPPLLTGPWPDLRADQLSEDVSALVQTRRNILAARQERSRDMARVRQIGNRMNEVVSAELELARLRITSEIVSLYTRPLADPREGLDRLADQHFFAFERLTEMMRTVDTMRLQLQQLPDLTSLAEVSRFETSFVAALRAIQTREAFLPTRKAQQELRGLIKTLTEVVTSPGLLAQQSSLIAMAEDSRQANTTLIRRVSELSDEVAETRNIVQAASADSLAKTGRLSARVFLLLLGIVVLASLASVMSWVRVRRQLLARLGAVSRRIIEVAQGDYGAPAPISGHDEIGRLEKALNVLRRRARDAATLRTQLEGQVIARTGDVVAQMKASDEARAEAERVSASKTEFLARMSHEIRTPLAGIIGMLDLLRLEVTDPSRRARAETALASARELLEITNDILDYASSDDPVNRGRPVHFRLRDLVGQLGHQLIPLARQRGVSGNIDLVEPAPEVLFGDVVKIRQIVGNLISNAIKYTEKGRVALVIESAVGPDTGLPVVSFTVSDTGIGMTQEAVAHAFDAYSRTSQARRSGAKGMGLGLAISRNLTEALGGALHVESAPGVGSSFTLTVPMEFGDATQIEQEETARNSGSSRQTVLVLDDHTTNRMVARGYLQRLGCDIIEASDGQSALALLRERDVDVALIDLDLPDMTGAKVAREITGLHPRAKLVLLTAHHIEDTDARRREYSVDLILSKPISPRALADLLGEPPKAVSTPPDENGTQAVLRQDIDEIGQETTTQILREFLIGLPDAVQEIKRAAPDTRPQLAHRLKGAASNFALTNLCAHLARIETSEGSSQEALINALSDTASDAARTVEQAAHSLGLSIAPASTKA